MNRYIYIYNGRDSNAFIFVVAIRWKNSFSEPQINALPFKSKQIVSNEAKFTLMPFQSIKSRDDSTVSSHSATPTNQSQQRRVLYFNFGEKEKKIIRTFGITRHRSVFCLLQSNKMLLSWFVFYGI